MAFCGSLNALIQFPSRSFSPEFKGAKKGSCKIPHDNNNVRASTKTNESSCSRGRVTGTCTDRAKWDVNDSAKLYRIEGWGAPYFSINSDGNVCVRPWGSSDGSDEIDIMGLIESLQRSNIKLPVVIRFPDIVLHRIQKLQECFDMAIVRYGYQILLNLVVDSSLGWRWAQSQNSLSQFQNYAVIRMHCSSAMDTRTAFTLRVLYWQCN